MQDLTFIYTPAAAFRQQRPSTYRMLLDKAPVGLAYADGIAIHDDRVESNP